MQIKCWEGLEPPNSSLLNENCLINYWLYFKCTHRSHFNSSFLFLAIINLFTFFNHLKIFPADCYLDGRGCLLHKPTSLGRFQREELAMGNLTAMLHCQTRASHPSKVNLSLVRTATLIAVPNSSWVPAQPQSKIAIWLPCRKGLLCGDMPHGLDGAGQQQVPSTAPRYPVTAAQMLGTKSQSQSVTCTSQHQPLAENNV